MMHPDGVKVKVAVVCILLVVSMGAGCTGDQVDFTGDGGDDINFKDDDQQGEDEQKEVEQGGEPCNYSEENYTIACWNLQVFGPTKAANETLVKYYADKLDDHDVFVVQEIRDKSGDAIERLAEELPEYNYVVSNRAGRTISKEQYAIFYDTETALLTSYDWQSLKQDEYERPPFRASFVVGNWSYTLYTIHMKPSNVSVEMSNLENLVGSSIVDTIVIGDLNADGSYYDEDEIAHFRDWFWAIPNEVDTTVAESDNTYDRIIFNEATENNYQGYGIMDEVTSAQSDHYMVWASFNTTVA